jgi:hypothetical protein
MRPHYRQGDVLLVAVRAIPDDARLVPRDQGRIVLALGEATGHAHAIADPQATLLETDLHERFVHVLREGGALLCHEEHDPILLPQGAYQVRRQREYAPGAVWRMVAD